uniref:Uncharacterized protein n=1 Tax=Rhizophora mucronata TaxID=61149 RepID=A0A2P2NAU1_RHIMU
MQLPTLPTYQSTSRPTKYSAVSSLDQYT